MGFTDEWNAWRARPFPKDVPVSEDMWFELLDIDRSAAGCIDTFSGRGSLDEWRIGVLERCLHSLHSLLPQIPKATSGYFEDLAALCRRVLGAVGRRN
jgi:hypothetical protein